MQPIPPIAPLWADMTTTTHVGIPPHLVPWYGAAAGMALAGAAVLTGWWCIRLRNVHSTKGRVYLLSAVGLVAIAFVAGWLSAHPGHHVLGAYDFTPTFVVYMPCIWTVAFVMLVVLGSRYVIWYRGRGESEDPVTADAESPNPPPADAEP
jgi:uncharacterized membrane protein